jgi:hypothetical protein
MTERKPPGTSWETWIDGQIRVATEEGAFDPLARWVKRQVADEQISVLPPSLLGGTMLIRGTVGPIPARTRHGRGRVTWRRLCSEGKSRC